VTACWAWTAKQRTVPSNLKWRWSQKESAVQQSKEPLLLREPEGRKICRNPPSPLTPLRRLHAQTAKTSRLFDGQSGWHKEHFALTCAFPR
jgi:hypothetical protein